MTYPPTDDSSHSHLTDAQWNDVLVALDDSYDDARAVVEYLISDAIDAAASHRRRAVSEQDWTAVPPADLYGTAHRHRHPDGRYCTLQDGVWLFETHDSVTFTAKCLRTPH